VAELKPTFVAYEPPEFIGSTETSVTKAQPEIISQAADVARSSGEPLIVGAGVSSMEDIKKSLELGAVGVAIATAVVKSPDPKAKLLELVEGFK
ncbi:MAG: Triosephosphate isomerase, partial [Candidatus Woesebacteria bacterium GW2011_GWF1_40_24]